MALGCAKLRRFCAQSEGRPITDRKPRQRPTQCGICLDERRFEIELALTAGVSQRAVAKKFNVSRDVCFRHLKRHVSPERRAQLVAGPMKLGELAEKATAEGTTLLDYLTMVRSVLMARFLAAAEHGDDQNTGLLGGKLNETLRLQANVTGELSKATSTINNNTLIMASPMMSELQQMLMTRLRPFPDALRVVVAGLEELSARTLQRPPTTPRLIEGTRSA